MNCVRARLVQRFVKNSQLLIEEKGAPVRATFMYMSRSGVWRGRELLGSEIILSLRGL